MRTESRSKERKGNWKTIERIKTFDLFSSQIPDFAFAFSLFLFSCFVSVVPDFLLVLGCSGCALCSPLPCSLFPSLSVMFSSSTLLSAESHSFHTQVNDRFEFPLSLNLEPYTAEGLERKAQEAQLISKAAADKKKTQAAATTTASTAGTEVPIERLIAWNQKWE